MVIPQADSSNRAATRGCRLTTILCGAAGGKVLHRLPVLGCVVRLCCQLSEDVNGHEGTDRAFVFSAFALFSAWTFKPQTHAGAV